MRNSGRAIRRLPALTVIGVVALLWGCSGIHLRPESYDWVTGERTAPAAVRAAQAAIAEAETAGAANVGAARYPLAKAREYILLAEDELSDRDLAAAETAAGIAKAAAEDAKAIAQRGK
jgi:hypothetical protein